MNQFDDLPQPAKSLVARSQQLATIIKDTIRVAGGEISFADYMALALYHPELGYYTNPAFTLGKLGDFVTAPTLSPLFAHCFARQCLPLFAQMKQPSVLEIGAGTGQFAADYLSYLASQHALPECYYIYEISPVLRASQMAFINDTCPAFSARIKWLTAPPSYFNGIIIANEVLDALPVHCFQVRGQHVLERSVNIHQDHLAWGERDPKDAYFTEQANALRERFALPSGYASEINLRLVAFIQTWMESLSSGMLFFADYGYGQAEYYHPERGQGTLTCFYQHHRHSDPFKLPGAQDITAHVDFTRVIEHAAAAAGQLVGYTTQAGFLLGNGLLTLAESREACADEQEKFELHQAIKTLTLPQEMGERIKIMAISKNFTQPHPLAGFTLMDRRRDL